MKKCNLTPLEKLWMRNVYLVLVISKFNKWEIRLRKITILLINEKHVLMNRFFFFMGVPTCFLFHWILIMLYHILNHVTFASTHAIWSVCLGLIWYSIDQLSHSLHMIQNLSLGLNFNTYPLNFTAFRFIFSSLFSFVSIFLSFKTPKFRLFKSPAAIKLSKLHRFSLSPNLNLKILYYYLKNVN